MKPDPLKAISVPQEPVGAVRDALWPFSGVCGIYPHRNGTVPHLSEVQMDELYALLSEMRGEGERGRCWVWAAIDPLSKLLLALEVGDRSLDVAQRLVHGVVSVLAPGVVPLFVADQLASTLWLLGGEDQRAERAGAETVGAG